MNETAERELLTTHDLADALGVSYVTVIRLTKDGVLYAAEGGGTGFPYRYDPAELEVCRVLALWRRTATARDTLASIAHAARTQRGEDPRSIVAAAISDAVVVTFAADEVEL